MQPDAILQKRTPFSGLGRAAHWACLAGLWLGSGCAAHAGNLAHPSVSAPFERARAPASSATEQADVLAGPVLDRAAFVSAVLRRNPTLEAARHGWRAALARVGQAGTLEDAMLDIGVAPLSVGSSEAPFGYEASVSQKLPWFGKRALEAAVSAAEAEAAKSDYESVKRELALTAVTLYQQSFVATKSLEINAAHIELMRAMRDAAIAQFSSGRGSAQDALQAEAALTHMEHDSVILASRRDVTLAQMNELLHRSPELSLPPPPAELRTPAEPDAATENLQLDVTRNRPDILAAAQRAHAEQVRAERAERESYPDFTLSTAYSSMWDMPQHRWMVGLGLNLPFQTGRRAAAADEARARSAQFEREVARLRDAARTRVFVALKQLQESRHVLGLFETRLLPVAKMQIAAARAGFITSRNPFLAVMDAERNLRGVELDHQMARAEYVQRRAELDHALGRIPGLGWKEATP